MEQKEIPEFDFEDFSREIRIKRIIDSKETLRGASRASGVSAPTLNRLENKKLPDVYTYHKVCKWLGKSMDYFFKKDVK